MGSLQLAIINMYAEQATEPADDCALAGPGVAHASSIIRVAVLISHREARARAATAKLFWFVLILCPAPGLLRVV